MKSPPDILQTEFELVGISPKDAFFDYEDMCPGMCLRFIVDPEDGEIPVYVTGARATRQRGVLTAQGMAIIDGVDEPRYFVGLYVRPILGVFEGYDIDD